MRARLAYLLTRLLYLRPVINDRPRCRIYYAVRNGTWGKFANFLRLKMDYRLRRTTVSGKPYAIRVEPTNACNLRCPLCPTGTGEIEREAMLMSPEALDAILSRCGTYALYAHLWVWGEPLLNKRLASLVATCRRHGIGSEVSSHLSLPLSVERIDSLITSGLDWLIVSNDATTAATYEQYRIGGDFNQVMRNMKAIVERKRALKSVTPFVEWQFVPMRHNEREMQNVMQIAREVGVDGVRFKPVRLDKTRKITFKGRIPADLSSRWAPTNPALVHNITRSRGHFLDYTCRFLWGTVTVYANGAMAPCCETTAVRDDLGNLFDQDFEQIWNGPAYRRARRVALGLAEDAEDRALACHGCKVFRKPLLKARSAQTHA